MSIKLKIIFSFLILAILIGLGNMMATAHILISLQEERLKTTEVPFLKRLAGNIYRNIIEEKTGPITSLLFDEKDAGADKVSYLLVFDKKGYLLAHTFLTTMPKVLFNLNQHIDLNKGYEINHVKNPEIDVYDIAVPVLEGIKRVGTIHMGIKSDYINNIVTPTQKASTYMLGITIVMILISLIAAVGISQAITVPIYALHEAVNKIINGKWESDVKVRANDEMGQLANAFNRMLSELKSSRRMLEETNVSLEEKIAERTRELQKNQTQLVQSERLASIGQLAAGVAHEINNPIGFISNNMEILEQYVGDYTRVIRMVSDLQKSVEAGDMEKAKLLSKEMVQFEQDIDLDHTLKDTGNLLQHNQKGLERVRKIVLDLKTFSFQGQDKMEALKVEEIIDSILSIVHNELKYKAELKKNYGDTPLIKGSPQRLGQVFINLFVNAAQAIEEKGVITVSTYRQDGHLCVDVSDTGKGIPLENLKKIFDPFFTTKPVGQGTGLGLSVSYEIIQNHGGDIRVRSKLGEGTTFTVMLPVV